MWAVLGVLLTQVLGIHVPEGVLKEFPLGMRGEVLFSTGEATVLLGKNYFLLSVKSHEICIDSDPK